MPGSFWKEPFLDMARKVWAMPQEYWIDDSPRFTDTDLLQKNGVSDEHIEEFLNSINLTDDGDYYIKVRDTYMTPETQLVNVDSERTVYLKDIDNALK